MSQVSPFGVGVGAFRRWEQGFLEWVTSELHWAGMTWGLIRES